MENTLESIGHTTAEVVCNVAAVGVVVVAAPFWCLFAASAVVAGAVAEAAGTTADVILSATAESRANLLGLANR